MPVIDLSLAVPLEPLEAKELEVPELPESKSVAYMCLGCLRLGIFEYPRNFGDFRNSSSHFDDLSTGGSPAVPLGSRRAFSSPMKLS